MAWSFVRNNDYVAGAAGQNHSMSAQELDVGDHVVVYVAFDASALTSISVSDTAGNTYTEAVGARYDDTDNFNRHTYAFYALNVTGHATNVIAVNINGVFFSGDPTSVVVMAQQFASDSAGVFDTATIAQINSDTITTSAYDKTGPGAVAVFESNLNVDSIPSTGTFTTAGYTTNTRPDEHSAAGYYIATTSESASTATFSTAGNYSGNRFLSLIALGEVSGLTLPITQVAGVGVVGSIPRSSTVAITGVAGVGVVGSVTKGADLTGVAAASSAGSVTLSRTVALTGVAGAGAVGSVAVGITQGLTGVAATGDISSVIAGRGLSGVSAAGTVGSVAAGVPIALTGVAGVGALGSVQPDHSNLLSGNTAAGSVGLVRPPNDLGGVAANTQVGTTAPGITLGLTQVSAASAVGTMTVGRGPALTQVAAAGVVGSVATTGSPALTQVAAAGAVGSLTGGRGITGVAAAGAVGSAKSNITLALSGVTAAGRVGPLGIFAGAVGHPRVLVSSRGESQIFSIP